MKPDTMILKVVFDCHCIRYQELGMKRFDVAQSILVGAVMPLSASNYDRSYFWSLSDRNTVDSSLYSTPVRRFLPLRQ
eukprot:764557-Hanusia_phi.AAC.2